MKRILLFLFVFGFAGQNLFAGPDNIAPLAIVSVSSELSPESGGGNVIDGRISVDNRYEWASQSNITYWGQIDYPWIQLTWDKPRIINRIILYDRVISTSHTAGGTLYFSDGTTLSVHAIPNSGLAKTVDFPPKKVDWVKFEVTDGDGLQLGLSEIEVYPAPEDYTDYISKVDPYIESARGRYFFFITGNQPFGMIGAAPMTRNKNQYGGGYNYNSTEVLGFPQVHGWMLSGITLMPTTGEVNPSLGEQNWKSAFTHDGEIVQPGYHRLFLNDYRIWVEQTATDRVSFYRLRYTHDAVARILLNLGGYVCTSTMTDAQLTKVSDTELEGSVNTTGRLWGGPDNVRIFFVVRFDKPFEQLDGWDAEKTLPDISSLTGGKDASPKNQGSQSYFDAPTTGASARYQVKAGDEIQVKFAISYTGIENARRNMEAECAGWDFDAIRKTSQAVWNEYLGRIDVKGGTDAQQIKFYTDLWHALLGRHKIDDISGDYPDYTQGKYVGSATKNAVMKIRTLPKNPDGNSRFHIYNSDAFWLTQWNLNILWGLAWPEVLDDMAACLVQYAENGGLLPRGPNAGGYSFIMTACPATNLIVSAYLKGCFSRKSPETAYRMMVKNHLPGGMMGGKEVQFYIKNGYFPGNAGITLEMAFQDWSLAQMAAEMGKKKDAAYYLKRSQGWTKLYHPEQKLIFPKDSDGRWLHHDPLNGAGWIEANAWQGTWSVSHAIPELATLMGGNDVLCDKLNEAFEKSEKDDFVFGYGGGYVSYANQPGCSNAHVFSHAGKPWLTQYWVRKVKQQAYGAVTPDKGYGGHDEDQGQMGGVSALMAIGLFNVQGTNNRKPMYDITSPIFDEITIRLHPDYYSGGTFKIRTYDNSKTNCYIQKAMLNGKPQDSFQFSHEDFISGGILEIWLGPKPNVNWGSNSFGQRNLVRELR
ncbi:MAG: GH92 family glycosyl hydrolase [Prevotellaceae bacterium]|jgi:predicted alpha-1,2-mannosidase|nr:GH92 family glycosyl hydrolase [Prevotellaceae bacterium]